MNRKIHASAIALAIVLAAPQPATAALPVIDIKGIAQMVQQVKIQLDQVVQLKAQLTAQSQMLQKLGSDISPELASIVGDATSVMRTAQGIGYDAKQLTGQLGTIYPQSLAGQTYAQILAHQNDWMDRTRDTRREAMEAQNAIFASQSATQSTIEGAVAASQGASGQTAAIQATNQLLAALSTQLTGLQTLLMTQMRAMQTAEAERAGIHAASVNLQQQAAQTSTRTNQVNRPW